MRRVMVLLRMGVHNCPENPSAYPRTLTSYMLLLLLAGSLLHHAATTFILRLSVGQSSVGSGQSGHPALWSASVNDGVCTYAISRTVYVFAMLENRAHENMGGTRRKSNQRDIICKCNCLSL
jgi:hypothetical protein